MKDQLQLLAAGIAMSIVAWAIWQVLGRFGLDAFACLALVVLMVDNFRLRRLLRDRSPP